MKFFWCTLAAIVFWGCSKSSPIDSDVSDLSTQQLSPEIAADAPAAPAALATPAAAPPMPSQNVCEKICSHTITMQCGNIKECLEGCLGMQAIEVCSTEMNLFLACTATKPVTAFECDEQMGNPALKDGYCVAEQAAVAACMDEQ